jgi:glycosyltransferase involved in cell wall biosynthesis
MHSVSVIITTYNSEQTIERLLNSIYAQKGINTLFNIEVIVVDDCSKDNTAQLLKEKFPQVLFFVNEVNSGGPNKGRNKGLSIASGEYICIADHDDEWIEDKIVRQLECISLAPIVSSGYNLYSNERGKEIRVNKQSYENILFFEQNVTFLKILSKNKNRQSIYIGSLMFHKSLKTILFEEIYGQLDFDWVLRLFENNASVEVNAPLYNRYFAGDNLSINENYRRNDYQYGLTVLNEYGKKYPQESRLGIKRLNGTYARYFYKIENMKRARYYFFRSEFSLKTILYILTSFVGHKWVKKRFNIFG